MYKSEIMPEESLFNEARSLAESPEEVTHTQNALDLYINSKPGTWRLVSHSVAIDKSAYTRLTLHYFIWATGE